MPRRVMHDQCACGGTKAYTSAHCRACWRASLPRKEAHRDYKGGRVTTPEGYVKVRDWDRSVYVFEHIKVMQGLLERPLAPGENVHHRNGIKDDNRPENLELWVKPQPKGVRVEDAVEHAIETLRRYAPQHLTDTYTQS